MKNPQHDTIQVVSTKAAIDAIRGVFDSMRATLTTEEQITVLDYTISDLSSMRSWLHETLPTPNMADMQKLVDMEAHQELTKDMLRAMTAVLREHGPQPKESVLAAVSALLAMTVVGRSRDIAQMEVGINMVLEHFPDRCRQVWTEHQRQKELKN